MFISIDGGDGTGKSTQIAYLSKWLREMGQDVVECRDPGSTPLGEAIRAILLKSDLPLDTMSEVFLFMAARSQMVTEIIRPALQAHKTVLSDRFLLSTLVYQGFAMNRPLEEIWTLGKIATLGILPDLMIVLDLPTKNALNRIDRPLDRIEQKGLAFHEKVREGFLKSAELWNRDLPGRCVIVDASLSPEKVAQTIQTQLLTLFPHFSNS